MADGSTDRGEIWFDHAHHRLRGMRQPCVNGHWLSMGKGYFRPPTESTPLNRSPKNLSQVITSSTPTAVPN